MQPETARNLLSDQINLVISIKTINNGGTTSRTITAHPLSLEKRLSNEHLLIPSPSPEANIPKSNVAEPKPSSPQTISDLNQVPSTAIEFIQSDSVFDKFAADEIPSKVLGAIFSLLVKLSYSLFIIGILILTATDQSARISFIEFVKDSSKRGYIITIIVLVVVIFALTELFKHDSRISPEKRKGLNFFTDLIRTATYSLLIYFSLMFIKETTADDLMILAFWTFISGYILFIFRKIFKWGYYFIGRGKGDYRPWSSPFISKDHALVITANEKNKYKDQTNKAINMAKKVGFC